MTTAHHPGLPRQETVLSYVRVSIIGTLPGGEVWSVNPVYDPTAEFGSTVNQTQLDAAAQAIANRSVPASLRALMSASAQRTGARVEVRDDADDSLIGISIAGSATPLAGTGTLALPYQSASVLSIRTNTPGGSGRGRIYWPALGATLGGVGRLSTPIPSAALADFKAYLLGIRTDLATAFPTIGFDLAVRSKTTHTTPHAVRIQLGDVIDTQRRRRDAQVENYLTLDFP